MRRCPRCKLLIVNDTAPTGESQIFGSAGIPDLCEPCWLAEDEEIEAAGTNDLPETLARYRARTTAV